MSDEENDFTLTPDGSDDELYNVQGGTGNGGAPIARGQTTNKNLSDSDALKLEIERLRQTVANLEKSKMEAMKTEGAQAGVVKSTYAKRRQSIAQMLEEGANDALKALSITMIDDYQRIYTQGLEFRVDVLLPENLMKLFYIFWAPIFFAFLVILVPLNGLHPVSYTDDDLALVYMDPWGYIFFQMVYCLIAFPCLVNIFTITFENLLPRWYIWAVLPIIVEAGVVFIYYVVTILAYDTSNSARSVMGLYGVLYEFVCIWISYGFASFRHSAKVDLRSQDDAIVERASRLRDVNRQSMIARNSGPGAFLMVSASPTGKGQQNATQFSKVTPMEISPFDDVPAGKDYDTPDWTATVWPFTFFPSTGRELPLVRINYGKEYLRTLMLSMLHAGMFAWCSTFTGLFMMLSAGKQLGYILLFTFITTIASVFVRMLGSNVDFGLTAGSCSLNVIAGLMTDTFYVVYQRNLFSGVKNWTEFAEFATIFAVIEVVMFQFCVTETYEKWHDDVRVIAKDEVEKEKGSFKYDLCYFYCATHGWLDGRSFIHKNALHLSYKALLRVSSSVAFLLFETFLRYSYNKKYYDAALFSPQGYNNLVGYVIVSMILDIIVVFPTEYMLRKRDKPGLMQHFFAFFNSANGPIYMGFFIWVIAHITTDVFVAKILYGTTTLGSIISHHPTLMPVHAPTYH